MPIYCLTNLLNAGHEITFNIQDTIILAPEMNIDSLSEADTQV